MKALAAADRPREKLVRVGADALGDNELVAVVLGAGQRSRGALELANSLLAAVGGLHRLTRRRRMPCAASPASARRRRRGCWRPSSWAAGRCCSRRPSGRSSARRGRRRPICCRASAPGRSSTSAWSCSTSAAASSARRCCRSAPSTRPPSTRARCSARRPSPVRRAWFCSIITRLATRRRAPTTCASPRASCAPAR